MIKNTIMPLVLQMALCVSAYAQHPISFSSNTPVSANERILEEHEKIQSLLQRYERTELAKMVLERDAWLEDANIQSVALRVRTHIHNTLEALSNLRVNGKDIFATVHKGEKTPDGKSIWFSPERARQIQIELQSLDSKSIVLGVYGLNRGECLRLSSDALVSPKESAGWRLSEIRFGASILKSSDFDHARSQIVPSKALLLRWQNAQGEVAQKAFKSLSERSWDPCGKMYESDAWTLRFERDDPLQGSILLPFEPMNTKK